MLTSKDILNTISNCSVISFVGNEKGSGKTTCLKIFLEYLSCQQVGITSIGVDRVDRQNNGSFGERYFIKEGTIVATANSTLPFADITKEILDSTDIMTSIGKVIIFRAKSSGNVLLAGPSTIDELEIVINKMKKFGAQKILLDGSLNRRSIADPKICDAVVLTFALLSTNNLKDFCDKISQEVENLSINLLKDKKAFEILIENQNCHEYLLIDKAYDVCVPRFEIDDENKLEDLVNSNSNIRYIFINGAFTKTILTKILILENKLSQSKSLKIVIKDATRLFINKEDIKNLSKIGISIVSIKKISIIGIFVNTFSKNCDLNQLVKNYNNIPSLVKIPLLNVWGGNISC